MRVQALVLNCYRQISNLSVCPHHLGCLWAMQTAGPHPWIPLSTSWLSPPTSQFSPHFSLSLKAFPCHSWVLSNSWSWPSQTTPSWLFISFVASLWRLLWIAFHHSLLLLLPLNSHTWASQAPTSLFPITSLHHPQQISLDLKSAVHCVPCPYLH